MNQRQALRALDGMTYKPGYSFQIDSEDPSLIVLRLSVELPNARTIHFPETTVSYTCVIGRHVWEGDYLYDYVFDWLRRFEAHELAEWLAFDGVRHIDPHAPGIDPDGRTI